jgi:hypothetical protein
MSDEGSRSDPFYVGYLALPRAHRLFLLAAVPMALVLIGAGAVGLAVSQPAWGDGQWRNAEAVEIEGVLRLDPYPTLHVEDGERLRSYLLVRTGKLGSLAMLEAQRGELDGAAVTARGWVIERDGRRILELDADGAGEPVVGVGPAVVAQRVGVVGEAEAINPLRLAMAGAEPVTVRGEIIDAKCYLGAMKPGVGRGHKACATLCVRGGIPPMLASRGADGGVRYHLLVNETGMALTGERLEELLPLIAEPVEVTGVESRVGAWRVLRLTRDAVKAL